MNDKYKKYIEYIANDIELPYIKSLEQYGLKDNECELVLSKVFNEPVIVRNNYVYNTDGNKIYFENSDSFWIKYEYDANGNEIYYENNSGYWVKHEYDSNDNEVYVENSRGYTYGNKLLIEYERQI